MKTGTGKNIGFPEHCAMVLLPRIMTLMERVEKLISKMSMVEMFISSLKIPRLKNLSLKNPGLKNSGLKNPGLKCPAIVRLCCKNLEAIPVRI